MNTTADLERRIIAMQHEIDRLDAENVALGRRLAATWAALLDADEAIGRLAGERGGPHMDRAQDAVRDAIAAWGGERKVKHGRS